MFYLRCLIGFLIHLFIVKTTKLQSSENAGVRFRYLFLEKIVNHRLLQITDEMRKGLAQFEIMKMHKIFEMICACIWDLLLCRYVLVSVFLCLLLFYVLSINN